MRLAFDAEQGAFSIDEERELQEARVEEAANRYQEIRQTLSSEGWKLIESEFRREIENTRDQLLNVTDIKSVRYLQEFIKARQQLLDGIQFQLAEAQRLLEEEQQYQAELKTRLGQARF